MNSKKLLIVTPTSPDKDSTFIKSQIDNLQPFSILHSGFRPYINGQKSIFAFPMKVNFIRIGIKRFLPWIYSKLYDKALSNFLLQNKYEVVLCNYGPQASNVYPACALSQTPLVAHFHGYDASVDKILKKYQKKYSRMFEGLTTIISVSNDMTNLLISKGANKQHTHTIPYGVNLDKFTKTYPEHNSKILIFVGRFTKKKAPDLLLKAFNSALQKVPDAILVMIGNGELHQLVLDTIKNLQIENSVKILDWQTPEEIVKQMKTARAYVQHSIKAENGDSEGTPNSILEASACGLPIISTFHAGIKEAVKHNVTGYLVEEGDWNQMGYYMAELLENPVLAGKMGEAAREHMSLNYALDKQIEKLSNVILSVSK